MESVYLARHWPQARDAAAVTSCQAQILKRLYPKMFAPRRRSMLTFENVCQHVAFHARQNVFAVLTRKHSSSSVVASHCLALFRLVDATSPGVYAVCVFGCG